MSPEAPAIQAEEVRADGAAIGDRVRTEQMRMLYASSMPAMLAATAFAAALAWHLDGPLPAGVLMAWLAVKLAIAIPRLAHGWMYRRRKNDSLDWLVSARRWLLLDGLAWGSAGVFLMPSHDTATMTTVAASLSGVATIATFVTHADWRACVSFAVPLLLPCVIYFLLRGDEFGFYGAASIGTFLFLLLSVARRSERHIVEMLTLRFANATLTEKLSSALDKAYRNSRSKDVFVANMSHELRTPLHGILGLTRALEPAVSNESKAAVRLIRRSGEHLLELISNVLEFSRFDAAGIDINPRETDVIKLIDETIAMCRPTSIEQKVELTHAYALDVPFVTIVDPFRLRQILLNLIGNAVKFTDAGGSVRVLVEEVKGGKVAITISDTGIGMSANEINRIFEPFSQGDASTTRRHGGTGLGLSITRAICVGLSGEISCSSVPEQGSRFVVTLPLPRIESDPVAVSEHELTTPASLLVAGKCDDATVLIVEDNEVNTLVAEYALMRFGLNTMHADSGAAAVDVMCTTGFRPELVLLDCQMPVMDGFEAARRIRAYEKANNLAASPLVALTANVFQRDRDKCRAAGMTAFLPKPFTDEQLRDVLLLFSIIPTPPEGRRSDSVYAALLL